MSKNLSSTSSFHLITARVKLLSAILNKFNDGTSSLKDGALKMKWALAGEESSKICAAIKITRNEDDNLIDAKFSFFDEVERTEKNADKVAKYLLQEILNTEKLYGRFFTSPDKHGSTYFSNILSTSITKLEKDEDVRRDAEVLGVIGRKVLKHFASSPPSGRKELHETNEQPKNTLERPNRKKNRGESSLLRKVLETNAIKALDAAEKRGQFNDPQMLL